MDVEQFRKAGYQAIDRICDYHYSLQNKPVKSSVKPGYLRKALPAALPTKGENIEDIANDYQNIIMPGLTHWQHPSFFAYFPTPATFEGIIGDLYATMALNPSFNWICSPACTELDHVVMDWAAQLFGLSEDFHNATRVGGGVIQPSASDSALVAIVAARSRYRRLHPDVPTDRLVIYTTTQTHSLGLKAGLILGLPVYAIPVTAEDGYRLRGHSLKEALERDKAEGKHPFVIIGTVGTTSSGAIDDMKEMAGVLHDHPDMWLHIDAAWLGVALSCPEYRERCHLHTINRSADSLCINFHKWGLVNIECTGFWVRDQKDLTEALDVTPPYLRSAEADAGLVVNYRNWSLTISRRFRSLKVWFVLRGFGVEGFQAHIRKSVKLGEIFAESIRQHPEWLELVTPTSFSLSVFRIAPSAVPGLSANKLNKLNKLYYRMLNERDELMLTQTKLNGISCVRFVVGAQKMERSHVEAAFGICLETAKLAVKEFMESEKNRGTGPRPQA